MLAFSLPVILRAAALLTSVAHPNHVPMYAHRDNLLRRLAAPRII